MIFLLLSIALWYIGYNAVTTWFTTYISVIMGEGLNLFDLLVIDLLWWRHSPRIRFSKVQEADMYLDPEKHISAFLRGVLLFVCTAAVGTWLMKILFV